MADRPDQGSTTSTPRWVRVFGLIFIVLALLVLIVIVFGGGKHGPGRHMPSSGPDNRTPPMEHVVQP